MKIKGSKKRQLTVAAENRARHKTTGAKRFVHVALNDRGAIGPDYSMAAFMAMSAVLSIVSKVKARAFRGRNK